MSFLAAIITAILSSSAITALAGGLWAYLLKRKKGAQTWEQLNMNMLSKQADMERKENDKLVNRIEQLISENAGCKVQLEHMNEKLNNLVMMLEEHCKDCPLPLKHKIDTGTFKVEGKFPKAGSK